MKDLLYTVDIQLSVAKDRTSLRAFTKKIISLDIEPLSGRSMPCSTLRGRGTWPCSPCILVNQTAARAFPSAQSSSMRWRVPRLWFTRYWTFFQYIFTIYNLPLWPGWLQVIVGCKSDCPETQKSYKEVRRYRKVTLTFQMQTSTLCGQVQTKPVAREHEPEHGREW